MECKLGLSPTLGYTPSHPRKHISEFILAEAGHLEMGSTRRPFETNFTGATRNPRPFRLGVVGFLGPSRVAYGRPSRQKSG